MKGKKWLSLALAGMLAVSALAGCGSSSSSTGSADTDTITDRIRRFFYENG